ncbi:MAG: paraslipin [Deltaproteobacteria bacterium]|nr:paraslipin [Deltaproteobacteria bacterium]
MSTTTVITILVVVVLVVLVWKAIVIVPQQSAYVVERLGKYSATLNAGLNFINPLISKITYRHSLKEEAVDIPEQICITADNVQVGVDGILYLKVLNPERASYGISDYVYAVSQLTQTTLRSEVGKLVLDKTFEARSTVNAAVVLEVDKASEAWGVKVLRYEIKNITPPREVVSAMEKQMKAEREKRAAILQSEGERDSKINQAEGEKQRQIKDSEARMQAQINDARGQAEAILSVAKATAEGLRQVAEALITSGGQEAMQLRIAEQYVHELGRIAKTTNTVVLPANLADIGSMITMAKGLLKNDLAPSGQRV